VTVIAQDLDSAFQVALPPRPYPGLRPFEKDEWPIFFGRERMADAVLSQLIDKRVLVVHGDSGCGKSSLVRAAVLPRLEQENARGGIQWRTCATAPGGEPLWNLAQALAGIDGGAPSMDRALEIRRAMNVGAEAPAALAGLMRRGPEDHLCILLDQFEELFAHARRHGSEEAQLLTDILVALHTTPPHGLYAVLTMRSEFLGACARFRGFAEMANATQYLLPRMNHDDLLRAIRETASLYNGEVTLDLAERLIADAGGGQDQLPLIQHGLMLLHHENARGSGPSTTRWRLGLEHYKSSGGLSRLLSDHADDVMTKVQAEHLPPDSRIIEDLFRSLTDINADGQAIRRPCTLADLVAVTGGNEPAVRCVVDAFRAEGVSFLKPYGSDPLDLDALIDISHEALIRCWSKINDPRDGWLIAEFKNGLVWRALLVQADSFERDPSNVLSPTTTDERERWIQRRTAAWAKRYGGGWDRVQRLLHASAAERDRKRAEQLEAQRRDEEARLREQRYRLQKIGLIALSILVALAGWLAYTAWRQSQKADQATFDATRQRDDVQLVNQELARKLTEVSSQLEAAKNTGTYSETLGKATRELNTLASDLTNQTLVTQANIAAPSAQTKPRVYIQIADESQRPAARELKSRLEGSPVGTANVIVPGIELVKASSSRSVVRCFRADECANEAGRLADVVNGLLSYPEVVVEDFSKRYGSRTGIRPRHYELWFASGDIRLKGKS
jgi:hypothetical protein